MLTLKNKGKQICVILLLLGTLLWKSNGYQRNEQVSDGGSNFPSDTYFASKQIDNVKSVEDYGYTVNKRLHPEIKYLKDCKYDFWEKMNIPGMPGTKDEDYKNNYIFSTAQCPQGLACTENYILITSYSEGEKHLGELMVFDRETGKYLVTLGMDAKSHLGGLTYDGENVWVCNSAEKTIERISFDFIELMALENQGMVVDASEVVDVYKVKNSPSCITYHNGRIWIATHTLLLNSKMEAYYYNQKQNELLSLSEYVIPPKVQGIAFGENESIYLSTSYGRNTSSFLKVYSSLINLSSKPNQPDLQVEMPPGSEELFADDKMLYVLFESAAEKYYEGTDGKGVSRSPIDKVLRISLGSLK